VKRQIFDPRGATFGLLLGMFLLMRGVGPQAAFGAVTERVYLGLTPILIYDARFLSEESALDQRGRLVLENGRRKHLLVTRDAKATSNHLMRTVQFYEEIFGRRSYDGKGSEVVASVNISQYSSRNVLGLRQNAAWSSKGRRLLIGAGGKKLDDLAHSLDLIAHEFTHAVIHETSGLMGSGQSGALSEHFADVMGANVHWMYLNPENPFLIGASVDQVSGLPVRNMLHPRKAVQPQPEAMTDLLENPVWRSYLGDCEPRPFNDRCGVHTLSGIPNRAAALIIQDLGWAETREMFYRIMTEGLDQDARFADYARALLKECRGVVSARKDACVSVKRALLATGMLLD
jgi:Zn-dependent metalloprotease